MRLWQTDEAKNCGSQGLHSGHHSIPRVLKSILNSTLRALTQPQTTQAHPGPPRPTQAHPGPAHLPPEGGSRTPDRSRNPWWRYRLPSLWRQIQIRWYLCTGTPLVAAELPSPGQCRAGCAWTTDRAGYFAAGASQVSGGGRASPPFVSGSTNGSCRRKKTHCHSHGGETSTPDCLPPSELARVRGGARRVQLVRKEGRDVSS